MTTKIIAIERMGSATSSLEDWQSITVRDDGADTQPVYGHVQVFGIADDGSRHALFSYFSDEVTYMPDELSALLVGAAPDKAVALASDLHMSKDRAFLHSVKV